MALLKDEVIVIKSINYSEADKILIVFSKGRGKYSLIAKGVRKIESKNRSSIQTLSRSSITYYEGKNLDTLVEASLIFIPDADKDRLQLISKILRVVNRLTVEDDEDPDIYERLSELLKSELELRIVNRFRIWILEHLGFLGNMRICSKCQASKELKGIDLNEMKVICKDCLRDDHFKSRYTEISKIKYESSEFDKAIDEYIEKVIKENDVSFVKTAE